MDQNDQPVTMPKERVQGLIAELEKTGSTVIVGTPALSELMVRSGVQAAQRWIGIMARSKAFKIVPFDVKSAIEVAILAGHALSGEGAPDTIGGTYAKLKYDRQIVAIAHTEGATIFYTDDTRQANLARRLGMTVKGLADCPIPTTAAQIPLNFGHRDGEEEPQ
jgi:hypothetical protein